MREFKFRIWDKENRRMHYGYEPDRPNMIDLDGQICVTGTGNKDEYGGPTDYINGCNQEDFVLMQYTGFKDKNGVEVFEGDILCVNKKGKTTKFYGVVQYKAENTAFFVVGNDIYAILGWHLLDAIGTFEIEVIGNIYQNPELLQGR